MKNLKKVFLVVSCFCNINCFAQQQHAKAADLTVVNRHLSISNNGEVRLDTAKNAGFAWLKNRQFKYGSIEFDVKGNDQMQGSFVGIAFHGLNDSTYECVYFRPFNFLAKDPVRQSHGVQYIATPKYDWPLLREQYPNKYEQAVIPPPDPNAWFHVRITVSPQIINVYVNAGQKPALQVKPLSATGGKKIGYWVGNGSPGDWRNLEIKQTDQ